MKGGSEPAMLIAEVSRVKRTTAKNTKRGSFGGAVVSA